MSRRVSQRNSSRADIRELRNAVKKGLESEHIELIPPRTHINQLKA